MAAVQTIHSPEFLHLSDKQAALYYGGSQGWYRSYWKRMAGCGPTTAANLLYYLSRTRQECRKFLSFPVVERNDFVRFLDEVWGYVTPGLGGVSSTEKFIAGIRRFGAANHQALCFRSLQVDGNADRRIEPSELGDFLEQAFRDDLPVAFLNWDNGGLDNLESWHWVTLIGYDRETGKGMMYDQGRRVSIDMGRWLKQTKKGGGFVAAAPC